MIRARYLAILMILLAPSMLQGAEGETTTLPAAQVGDSLTTRIPLWAFVTGEDSLSIVNGEALSIICRLELWQKRKMWFDRLRIELVGYVELTYDRWSQRFRAECLDAGGSDLQIESPRLDSLVLSAGERLLFPFALEANDYARESYVACGVELKYLTPDKLSELKDWLFSGKRAEQGSARDRQTSFPGKILNVVLSSTGFRNRSFLKSSHSFYPGQLEGAIKFPTPLNK